MTVTLEEFEAASEREQRASLMGDPVDPADAEIIRDWIAPFRNAHPSGRRGARTWSAK